MKVRCRFSQKILSHIDSNSFLKKGFESLFLSLESVGDVESIDSIPLKLRTVDGEWVNTQLIAIDDDHLITSFGRGSVFSFKIDTLDAIYPPICLV